MPALRACRSGCSGWISDLRDWVIARLRVASSAKRGTGRGVAQLGGGGSRGESSC